MEKKNIWYFVEWMGFLKLRQKDIVERCGWYSKKVNRLYHDSGNYNNDDVVAVSKALDIDPYELFMMPEKAMVIRILELDEQSEMATGISLHFTTRMLQDLARSNALRKELDRLNLMSMMERS